jgi:uncharacterized surface protein with fasciclin (FAS1) repeats
MIQVHNVTNSFKTLAAVACVMVGLSSTAFAGAHKSAPAGDVVDVAVAAGSFNTLVAAIKAAELVDALKGDGPFTVFAPTDEAFAALPEGTVDNLLKPENKAKLQAVLLYHVVSGKVMAADITAEMNPETLQGATLKVVPGEGWSEVRRSVTVNDAKVVSADVAASGWRRAHRAIFAVMGIGRATVGSLRMKRRRSAAKSAADA